MYAADTHRQFWLTIAHGPCAAISFVFPEPDSCSLRQNSKELPHLQDEFLVCCRLVLSLTSYWRILRVMFGDVYYRCKYGESRPYELLGMLGRCQHEGAFRQERGVRKMWGSITLDSQQFHHGQLLQVRFGPRFFATS